jgi:hypothetical protein
VQESDTGSNFFVSVQDVGQPMAKVVTENLLELNEDVKGTFVLKVRFGLFVLRSNIGSA